MTQINPPVLPITPSGIPASPLRPERTQPIRPVSEKDKGQEHSPKHDTQEHETQNKDDDPHYIDIEV